MCSVNLHSSTPGSGKTINVCESVEPMISSIVIPKPNYNLTPNHKLIIIEEHYESNNT